MLLLLISWTVMVGSSAQATMEIVRNNKQKAFKKTIPAGNYSVMQGFSVFTRHNFPTGMQKALPICLNQKHY